MLCQTPFAHAARAVLSAVWGGPGRRKWRGLGGSAEVLGLLGLLLALWLAPVLGQMHRALHSAPWRALPVQVAVDLAASAQPGAAGAQRPATTAESVPVSAPPSWLERLFASHSSDADCLVFDQLAHDGPPQFAAWPDLAWPPARFVAWWLDATLVATTAAPCQARAPPTVL